VWTAQLSTGDGVVLLGPGMAEFGTRAVADTEVVDYGPTRIYVAGDCDGHQWIFATPLP
jgi:hypothetical protein